MASPLEALQPYLPQEEGLLPLWLLLIAVTSVGNSIQSYITTIYTERVYSGPAPSASNPPATPSTKTSPVTPFSARTFGTWTFISSIIRLYAAYNISNPAVYQLAFWSYGVAFAHFTSEWFVFKSTHWSAGLAGPVVVSTTSLLWMWLQWGFYVQ